MCVTTTHHDHTPRISNTVECVLILMHWNEPCAGNKVCVTTTHHDHTPRINNVIECVLILMHWNGSCAGNKVCVTTTHLESTAAQLEKRQEQFEEGLADLKSHANRCVCVGDTSCVSTLQHKATHGNTRQHTATHGNTRQYAATH